MEPLLPNGLPLEAMEDSRRQQQHYVRTAEVQRNLRETKVVALRVLDKMADRSVELDRQEAQAQAVMESSEEMWAEAQAVRESRTCWGWLKQQCCGRHRRPTSAPSPTEGRKVFRFSRE